MSSIAGVSRHSVEVLYSHAHRGVVTAGEMTSMGVEAFKSGIVDIVKGRFSWSEFLLQVWFMLRVSLAPTIMVAIPFGVIISVQIGAVANQIGASSFSGAVNGIGILRQAAPLVTSLMISGVVGSAITSDLGARTVREEIDALKVMGISPIQRLVAPRVFAALVVSVVLTFVVAMTSMVTAYIMNVGGGGISGGTYMSSFVSFAETNDLLLAQFKALIFGFVATIVASHKGLSATGGPKGVADAVNQAVVLAVIVLSIINLAITQAYVMLVDTGL